MENNKEVKEVTLNDKILKELVHKDKYQIDKLNIPDIYIFEGERKKITKIGKKVFKNCENLKQITLPNTIKEIEEKAFFNCKNLEEIIIPESIKIISKAAFCGCKSLHKLIMKEGIEKIKGFAFANCPSLKETKYPESLKEVKESTFFEVKIEYANPTAKPLINDNE